MRSLLLFALFIYLVPCLVVLAARIPPREHLVVLEAREQTTLHTTATKTTTTHSGRTKDTASSTTDSTTATTKKAASTTTNGAAKTRHSGSKSSTTESAPTATASLNQPSIAINATSSGAHDALPLQPIMTPGLGVAGAILVLSGLALAFIGIQNQRVLVFLSTALLGSLGVVVLIVYMMDPPATDAVQGAYVVAAFFTGVMFGGVSIVFKELTEGLGCLLGGFCLSMWLLTLTPGGLITESGSKAGFIIALSAGPYALSYSSYTRLYVLVPSNAIAGATAFTLGVDCYSRAGWKEFWLYLWDLNDGTFPHGTDTYPISRSIRVESAVVIVVTALGIVSQLRLWNVVRRRTLREKKQQEEEERRNDEIETEVGRRLQEYNVKERAEWEARHGERSETTVTSTTEVPDGSKNGDATNREIGLEKKHKIRSHPQRNGQAGDEPDDPAPEGIPLPESPSSPKFCDRAATAARVQSDNASVATATAGSEARTLRSSIRRSGTYLLRRLSRGHGTVISGSEEFLVSPNSDGASHSSRQAIMDEGSEFGDRLQSIASDAHDEVNMDALNGSDQSPDGERNSSEATAEAKGNTAEETAAKAENSDKETIDRGPISDRPEEPKTKVNDEKIELNAEKVKALPGQNTKIVQTYRTGEWAKHLSDAEAPEPEPITRPETPSEGSEEAEEVAAPVNTTELLQTPLNAKPPPAPESRLSVRSGLNDANEDRRLSNASDMSSQPRQRPLKHHRSHSTPYLPLSPSAGQTEGSQTPSPTKPKWKEPHSLMAVREDRMRSRLSLGSTNHDPWASRTIPGQTIEASAEHSPTFPVREEDEDEAVPLSRRRAMLHHRKARQNTPKTPLRWSRSFSGQGSPNSMAAWRQSVQEDLSQKRDPLGFTHRRAPGFGLETPSPSSPGVGEATNGGTQGAVDLNELHREAMRRMQAAVDEQAD